MALDPCLWAALEAHGVTEAHMEMLLRVLSVQKNGSWTWNVHDGHMAQCDLRLTFSPRPYDVQRVSRLVLYSEG